MIYYKVKPLADQVRKNVNKVDILIANELYTIKELEKFAKVTTVFVSSYFDKIEISSRKTYFMFGARFANHDTGLRY